MTVDVIIPVYRPDEKLNRLLTALESQTVKPERIIIVHTGEVLDGEPDYLAKNICFRKIAKESFDHGGSRNLGASLSMAEVMVFLTQDAVPADEYLLEELVTALGVGGDSCTEAEHERIAFELGDALNGETIVAAAYARQLPCEDCRTVEKYIREFNYPAKSELRTKADIPARGIKAFCLSNVCAAYRRDVFDLLGGFVEQTIFNEDMLFGAKAVNAGFAVVYAAEAGVYHSHNLGLSDQFRRNFDNAVSQAEHPEVFAAVSSEKEGMKLVRYCLSRMKEDGKLYLAPYFVLNCACRYAGFFLGKRYRKLPMWLVRACSLNRRYWVGR